MSEGAFVARTKGENRIGDYHYQMDNEVAFDKLGFWDWWWFFPLMIVTIIFGCLLLGLDWIARGIDEIK